MADVGGLVRIDVGMLDDDLTGIFFRRLTSPAQHTNPISPAIQPDVDITVPGHLKRRNPLDRSKRLDNLRSDDFRRLFQLPR